MFQSWSDWYWKLGLASLLAIGQAVANGNYALAQIKPDSTLGTESSVVTPNMVIRGLPSDQIDGGATRGANLFHSFLEFNVGAGGGVYFTNPAGIENIISRVTGSNASNIFGKLGVLGSANLFLINPNGIVFGPNASLDVAGSFVASTASSLKFADGTEFSATAPQTLPLLTISVPIGLQFGGNQGSILNQSQVTDINGNTVGLQVMSGQTVALVGGNINFDNGTLQAPGSRVELGGLAGAGTIGLNVDDAGHLKNLSFPNDIALADVSLTNGSEVNVQAGGGGSIVINAQNLNLAGDQNSTVAGASGLLAGIASGSGSVNSQAGDIDINVTKAITLNSGSFISNTVGNPIYYIVGNLIYPVPNGAGKGGDINITTGSLSGTNGAFLNTATYGQGDAGTVKINANGPVSFDNSSASSQVNLGATGNGGDVSVTADSLSVTNGATLNASTSGNGDAGSVKINASGSVSFDEVGSAYSLVSQGGIGNSGGISIDAGALTVAHLSELNSSTTMDGQGRAGDITIKAHDSVLFDGGFAFSRLELGGIGSAGNILITTEGSVSVTGIPSDSANSNIGQLVTATFGEGNAGNITIKAGQNVLINGKGSDLYTLVGLNMGVGNAGNITIDSKSLSVINGARLVSQSENQGNAGSITINANNGPVLVKNGAQLLSVTRTQGNAGSITINANNGPVSFDNGFSFSTVEQGATGKGGGINITAGSLSLTNGAQLNATTSGQGDAGNVMIATSGPVFLDGVSNGDSSGAFSSVEKTGVGKGGDVNVTAGSLSVTNGAQLNAITFGQGEAGNVTIDTSGMTSFDGVGSNRAISGAFSSSQGSGSAGNLEVTASSIRLDQQAVLNASTAGKQGNITLHSGDLILRRGSNITTSAIGSDPGGNININTDNLVAVPQENSDITANATNSSGGQVNITAQGIFGFQLKPTLSESDITATSALGPQFNGRVQVNTPIINPSYGVVKLPVIPINVNTLIANTCIAGRHRKGGSFIVTGSGGLPTRPGDALVSPYPTGSIRNIPSNGTANDSPEATTAMQPSTSTDAAEEIVPATGWVFNNKGQVMLTAQAPSDNLYIPWLVHTTCHAD